VLFPLENAPEAHHSTCFLSQISRQTQIFFENRRNPLLTQELRKTVKSCPNVTGVAKSYRRASFYRKVDCFAIGFSRASSRLSPTQSPGGRLPTFGHLVFATPKSTMNQLAISHFSFLI